jgi:hypothetical protein
MFYPAQQKFRKSGFNFQVLLRTGPFALVGKSRPGYSGYEVAIIRPHGPYKIAGKSFPEGESYPSSADWGTYGWTYRTKSDALARFKSLTQMPFAVGV